MKTIQKLSLHQGERGAVLIVSLMFLVILTLLAVTAMTGTTMEQRMAGNTRDLGVALQAAESALRDARRDINAIAVGGFAGTRIPAMHPSQFGSNPTADVDNGTCNATGLCRPASHGRTTNAVMPPTLDIDAMDYVEYGKYTGAPTIPGVANKPRYIIEIFCLPHLDGKIDAGDLPCYWYRITARGYGGNPNTQVTLQEMFIKEPL